MEYVWAGEPHMADVGSQPCPDCNMSEEGDAEPMEPDFDREGNEIKRPDSDYQ